MTQSRMNSGNTFCKWAGTTTNIWILLNRDGSEQPGIQQGQMPKVQEASYDSKRSDFLSTLSSHIFLAFWKLPCCCSVLWECDTSYQPSSSSLVQVWMKMKVITGKGWHSARKAVQDHETSVAVTRSNPGSGQLTWWSWSMLGPRSTKTMHRDSETSSGNIILPPRTKWGIPSRAFHEDFMMPVGWPYWLLTKLRHLVCSQR